MSALKTLLLVGGGALAAQAIADKLVKSDQIAGLPAAAVIGAGMLAASVMNLGGFRTELALAGAGALATPLATLASQKLGLGSGGTVAGIAGYSVGELPGGFYNPGDAYGVPGLS